ncbi:hypothetical protein DERP_011223 [Dermatophagoides pteronyssinus]|uniref:Uncharacterized protein n=1 Tax=Dermatophagoides pteronyssinus TaxID=6956 RepID=A0ABQ8JCH0_DERPT|nr:hypothetical protein DERP_011223 [Dermatophagoides pteronyssinus]
MIKRLLSTIDTLYNNDGDDDDDRLGRLSFGIGTSNLFGSSLSKLYSPFFTGSRLSPESKYNDPFALG